MWRNDKTCEYTFFQSEKFSTLKVYIKEQEKVGPSNELLLTIYTHKIDLCESLGMSKDYTITVFWCYVEANDSQEECTVYISTLVAMMWAPSDGRHGVDHNTRSPS